MKTLKELVESDFAELTKVDLFDVCEAHGIVPHANSGEGKLKQLLIDLYQKKVNGPKLDQTLIKGLTGFPWAGLRKFVHLRRPEGVKKNRKVSVSWNGNTIAVPYDHPKASIPWPHFLILRNAQAGSVDVKSSTESQPQVNESYNAKHNVEDQGDDPGSKSEWKSLHEYLVSMWEEISEMKDRDKIAILSQLTDNQITRSWIDIKKWDSEDIHNHLAALLGIDLD